MKCITSILKRNEIKKIWKNGKVDKWCTLLVARRLFPSKNKERKHRGPVFSPWLPLAGGAGEKAGVRRARARVSRKHTDSAHNSLLTSTSQKLTASQSETSCVWASRVCYLLCFTLCLSQYSAAYLTADSQGLTGDTGQTRVSLWKAVRSWWKEEKKLLKTIEIVGHIIVGQ